MADKNTPSWRQWLAEKLNPAQASISSVNTSAYPESIMDFEKAYSDIEIIHRAIELIISACTEIPFIVEGSGPAKKINSLLNIKPNPFVDRARLFRQAFLDFQLDGNAFFYYDGTHIFSLPANDVEVVSDPKTFISHYNYLVNNTQASTFYAPAKKEKNVIRFETNEIIHVMNENETSIYRGVSRIKPSLRLIELYYHMINFQRQFFKNNALPGFVLTTENVLSERVKTRLLEAWANNYTSLFAGARSPAILDGGVKIDSFSSVSFDQLDFENSIERVQQDMAKALGVPYVLLKSGNNANIDANQKLFYLQTILPILNQFSSAFAHFFNNNIQIRPDKLAVPALQPDNKVQATYYSILVNTGIITPNEARIGLRFPELEGSDEIRIPQNIAGSAVDPTQGGRPTDSNTTDTTNEI